MSIEAMKQAWEAEQKANPHTAYNSWCRGYEAALRTAIEQAEKQEPWPEEPAGHKSGGVQPPLQEPVACKHEWFRTGAMEPGECRCIRCGKWGCFAPPAAQRQWVGLTDEEMLEALLSVDPSTKRLPIGFARFSYAVEAKLREKNT